MKFLRIRLFLSTLSILFIFVAFTSSCTTRTDGAKIALEEHLKSFNPRSIEIDFFHTDPSAPDRAYVSATVTYNYATSDGSLQKEYLGYILKKDGESWKVAENTRYTKDPSKAETFLSGKKG